MVSKLASCKLSLFNLVSVAQQTGLRLARSIVCALATLPQGAIGWSVICDQGLPYLIEVGTRGQLIDH